jgi:transketolase
MTVVIIFSNADLFVASLAGHTEISFTEDVPKRFQAYGWNTLTVMDGDTDLEGIAAAIDKARASDKPTLISIKYAHINQIEAS